MNLFLDYQKKIFNYLKQLKKDKLIDFPEDLKAFTVELPPKNNEADISCNAVMILTKFNKKSSLEIGNLLKKYLLEEKISSVESSILNSLNTGNSLDEVSTDFGLKIQSYKGLTRDSSLLPRNVLAEIFDEPRSNLASSYSSISLAGGDKLIFRLEGINESAMSITKEEKATLQDFFLKERSNSELLELQANMRDEASVSIKKSFN